MNTESVEKKFKEIGANIKFGDRVRNHNGFSIDVQINKGKETFVIDRSPEIEDEIDITVLDADKQDRHLLLLLRREVTPNFYEKEKFLCGHDERHWFVSPITGSASSVLQAKNSLRPSPVQEALRKSGVRQKEWNKRKNDGYTRQGEWFFVPAPEMDGREDLIIHRNEPIARSGGKPHMVEELVRYGGDSVQVSTRFPNGLTDKEFKEFCKDHPDEAKSIHWQARTRNAKVFARGKITHLDHSTVFLQGWHEVIGNSEIRSGRVAFLD